MTGCLNIPLSKQVLSGKDYVDLIDQLNDRFGEDDCPVHSFPEMCAEAWSWRGKEEQTPVDPEPPLPERGERVLVLYRGTDGKWLTNAAPKSTTLPTTSSRRRTYSHSNRKEVLDKVRDLLALPKDADELNEPRPELLGGTYDVDQIVDDGCFLEPPRIQLLLERLRSKKNLILQGPPGTGKTWLDRRLAYAHIGRKDQRRVRAVQFHPSLSYEDFVRGYRPSSEERLDPVDGVFMQIVRAAHGEPESDFVLVIEEINRGNPAQVFGELLTLLEADKRNRNEALELSYRIRTTARTDPSTYRRTST